MKYNTIINRLKAKISHFKRTHDQKHNLQFNDHLKARKLYNKAVLLCNLMEATNTTLSDTKNMILLENLIEQRKKQGVITEFYTNPMEDK